MKVFLSWSGSRSKAVAEAFCQWLPHVIQSIDPWISSDIEKGARWNDEIAGQLEITRVGIICLTQDNLAAPWILFESGALSKTKDAYVCTFLLDIKPASVEPPLGQFQHTAFEKQDVFQLLETINGVIGTSGERSLSDAQLGGTFEVWWPRLEQKLNAIGPAAGGNRAPVRRPDRDVLEEILEVVRGIQRPSSSVAIEESPAPKPRAPRHEYRVIVQGAAESSTQTQQTLVLSIMRSIKTVSKVVRSSADGDLRLTVFARRPSLAALRTFAEHQFGPDGWRVVKISRETPTTKSSLG